MKAKRSSLPTKHVFIIAGEASGDAHAARLVKELSHHDITFSGIGGTLMQNMGVELIYPLAQFGVTGLTEVVKQFGHIKKAYKLAKQFLQAHPIDLLILVDYPGFNLRFARFAKSLGIKILYYISPQIWAWKANRIHHIKKYIDVMAVIFPFEKDLYQKAGVKAYFVGHPLSGSIDANIDTRQFKKDYHINQELIIGLMPGSRQNEIKRLLPIIKDSAANIAKRHRQVRFLLPVARTLKTDDIKAYFKDSVIHIDFISNRTEEVIACCHSLIVASGTASLEVALMQKPMVIIYKTSRLTYSVATQVIKTPYIGLCNLLAKKMIVPEIIQDDLTVKNLVEASCQYIENAAVYHKSKQHLKFISSMLENNATDCRLCDLVLSELKLETRDLVI